MCYKQYEAIWKWKRNNDSLRYEIDPQNCLRIYLDLVVLEPGRVIKNIRWLGKLISILTRGVASLLFLRPRHTVDTLEVIVQEAAKVKIALPNVTALREALKTASEWAVKVDKIQVIHFF